jgi:hypothetical protein
MDDVGFGFVEESAQLRNGGPIQAPNFAEQINQTTGSAISGLHRRPL